MLALSMRMHESVDEQQILHLTTTAVPALARCHLDAVYLFSGGWQAASGPCTRPDVRADVESQFAVLSSAGGAVGILGESWGWAFPLRSVDGHFGFLVVAADDEPSPTEQFLPRTLAQQTGIALANARTNLRERQATAELQAVNVQLGETVSALRRSTEIHDRLTRVAAAGEGRDGLVQAVHELTGYPVAVEDRQGNLMAWAGPGRPERYPKDPPAVRAELLGRATHLAQPVRDGARLLAVAQPRPDVIGVLVLFDPAATAGEQEQVALEHGATVLAMEMARLASVAEAEMRLQRSVMDELLAGSNDTGVLGRAQALGYDLERAHRVVIVAPRSGSVEGTVFEAARTVVREMGYGTLLTARAGVVVVLADADCDWDQLRTAIMNELGGTP
ncbi:MAG: CdaR family transcriptional regulator, partial [Actinobacteria bacterium]|nr:CdaR family transcriptional regulator [Actinomycetota bacterium]